MAQVFEQLCPVYMSYGMSYEQFWYGQPCMVKAFHRAHMLRLNDDNYKLWLQGIYVYNAFSVVLSNQFSGKGKRKLRYFEKPLDIVPKSKEERELERKREQQKIIDQLTLWGQRFNANKKG